MLMEKLLSRITKIQQKKKRLNSKDETKSTPMHYAARYQHYHMIEFLIKNGASEMISFPFMFSHRESAVCNGTKTIVVM